VGLIGRQAGKLCFVQDHNVSSIHGLEMARKSARKWYEGAHYQFLFFRTLAEAKAKREWPKIETTKPIEFRADDKVEAHEGELYTNSSGEVRQYQPDADVRTTFCGDAPAIPRDAKWFALVLHHPPRTAERNKVMLWEIKDAPAAAPADE
jgi:hypothetical protein